VLLVLQMLLGRRLRLCSLSCYRCCDWCFCSCALATVKLAAKRIITIVISTATTTHVSPITIVGVTNNQEDTFMILEEITPYNIYNQEPLLTYCN
jgi:hypothetical protein